MRDASTLSIRLYSQYPKIGSKNRARSTLSGGEPITEMNTFGYNPALERRLCYRPSNSFEQTFSAPTFVNIYYLVKDPLVEAIYRSDVLRNEGKEKMSIKESEDMKKSEEFVNVETRYRKVREIMMSCKFGTLF